jgi:hypothetical protein
LEGPQVTRTVTVDDLTIKVFDDGTVLLIQGEDMVCFLPEDRAVVLAALREDEHAH